MAGARSAGCLYLYSPDRKAERPLAHLASFKGTVQVDGYPGFEQFGAHIRLAACWAHARRKFYEVHQATASPVAAEALRRIAELYAIETTIRGETAVTRQSMRRARSLPLVGAMKLWLEAQLAHIPPRSSLADAARYALNRWDALCVFRADGRIELDTNTVERAIRPVALGRKNHLLAGLRQGRWPLGDRLLPPHHRQAQRRRAIRLSQRRARADV
jgi:transposase